MRHSRIAGYRRLRELDPGLCQAIVRLAEDLAARHNLEPAVAVDVKQTFCQFALDLAGQRATASLFAPEAQWKGRR